MSTEKALVGSSDRYQATVGRVQLTGIQALARLPIDQHRRDHGAPFGRVCRPADGAGVVSFLMSEDAGCVTGQRIVVDGGERIPDVY